MVRILKIPAIITAAIIALILPALFAIPAQASSLTISYVSVTESNFNAPGESASVNFILNGGNPDFDVTINFSNNGQCTLNDDATGSLLIEANNSTTSATIKAINDENIEGQHNCTFTFITASADPDFNGINQAYSATINDNDGLPSLNIVVTQDSHIREGNLAFKNVYSVVRGEEEPTAPITLTVWTDAQCALKKTSGDGYTSQISLNVEDYPVPITVVANDDEVAEGDHTCHIQHRISTSDTAYKGNLVDSRYVTVEDNEAAPKTPTSDQEEESPENLTAPTVVLKDPPETGFVGQATNQPIRLTRPDAVSKTFIMVTVSAVIVGAILGWWRWGRIGDGNSLVDKE